MGFDTEEHYARLASAYNGNWAHDPDYVAWMSRRIMDALAVTSGDRVADIGAGTGLFLGLLGDTVTEQNPVVCIDPSRPMLDQLPDDPRLRRVQATAEDVASGAVALPYDRLDAVLIKEAIHHVSDIPGTIAGLAARLAPGGRFLIVTLPPDLDYPLFPEALERFRRHQPDPVQIVAAMRAAGLTARLGYAGYPVRVAREHYVELVRHRWMSVLSTFSDAELEAGARQIQRAHPAELRFTDMFALVLGVRDRRAAGS